MARAGAGAGPVIRVAGRETTVVGDRNHAGRGRADPAASAAPRSRRRRARAAPPATPPSSPRRRCRRRCLRGWNQRRDQRRGRHRRGQDANCPSGPSPVTPLEPGRAQHARAFVRRHGHVGLDGLPVAELVDRAASLNARTPGSLASAWRIAAGSPIAVILKAVRRPGRRAAGCFRHSVPRWWRGPGYP